VRPALPSLDRYRQALEPVWESRMLSNFATQCERFEALVGEHTGARHALAVSSGDIGLTLAVAALGVPAGSEALVPSFTFNSTLHALLWNGLRPRFVDVEEGTYGVDPDAVARALSDRTGLIVGTHVFGVPCDVRALESLAEGHGVPLLLDAAQAIATTVDGRHVSAWGDASVFSFSATKLVTTGEGGLAAIADDDVAERFLHLRAYGFRGDYMTRWVGLNGKLSELHAALGCLTFGGLEDEVAARRRLVARYRGWLEPLGVDFQAIPEGVSPSLTYCAVELQHRDRIARRLADEDIETKAYFRPLHTMAPFAALEREPLPVTVSLAGRVLCLPLYGAMEMEDVDRVCATIASELAAIAS
jgi:dTDP-4-amino-4,6-dideoxygalactose transaminase